MERARSSPPLRLIASGPIADRSQGATSWLGSKRRVADRLARAARPGWGGSRLTAFARRHAFLLQCSTSKRHWVQNDVEYEFLKFYDFCPNAGARFPPSVRIKTGVAFSLNLDTCQMAFHVSIEHPAYSSGVIHRDHEHNEPELVLVAPRCKNLAFTFCSRFVSRNLHDVRYAKPSQLPNLPCRRIFVREPSADELKIFSTRRISENRHSRRDAAMHEVGRLQRSSAARIGRYNDDVGRRNRLVDDKYASCGS
jgi:hypothetical protein